MDIQDDPLPSNFWSITKIQAFYEYMNKRELAPNTIRNKLRSIEKVKKINHK